MPHEEQIEWPSFETVLRDVAPDSPTARSLASADQRAQYSATAEAVRAGEDPQVQSVESLGDLAVLDTPPVADLPEVASPAADNSTNTASSTLPEPLAPLDLDTSSIRALLEPRSIEREAPIVEDALSTLAPLPELDLETLTQSVDGLDTTDHADEDPSELVIEEIDLEPAFAPVADEVVAEDAVHVAVEELVADEPEAITIDEPVAIETVETIETIETIEAVETLEFDAFEPLAFEPDPIAYDSIAPLDDDSLVFELAEEEIQKVDEANELEIPEPLADPFFPEGEASLDIETDLHPDYNADVHHTPDDNIDFESMVVNVEDLQVEDLHVEELAAPELPESVTSVPGIELPTDNGASVEVFDDLALTNLESLDQPAIASNDVSDATFEAPGLDLFDLNDDSDSIEQDRIALHGDDLYESSGFDSIAAADEIETDLDQLIDFSTETDDDDNVIPLRPDIEVPTVAETPAPIAEEGPLLTGGTGWVALAPEPTQQAPDPWADMRPAEEPKKSGFWANRPKFFGGDERRKRRSERRETEEVEPLKQAVDVTFDKECPRCGSECQVDLDDPIGRRVHVSCPSCQNIWYTPYILEDSQAG